MYIEAKNYHSIQTWGPLHTQAKGCDRVITGPSILIHRPYHWHGLWCSNHLFHYTVLEPLGLHLIVWSEFGRSRHVDQWEILYCNGDMPSILCVKWLKYVNVLHSLSQLVRMILSLENKWGLKFLPTSWLHTCSLTKHFKKNKCTL